jgi:hypothetical protein
MNINYEYNLYSDYCTTMVTLCMSFLLIILVFLPSIFHRQNNIDQFNLLIDDELIENKTELENNIYRQQVKDTSISNAIYLEVKNQENLSFKRI